MRRFIRTRRAVGDQEIDVSLVMRRFIRTRRAAGGQELINIAEFSPESSQSVQTIVISRFDFRDAPALAGPGCLYWEMLSLRALAENAR